MRVFERGDRWVWLPIAASALLAAALPFLVERKDADWHRFRGERAGQPLLPEERIYQLDTDQPPWLALMADFPGYYRQDAARINRPVYPAIVSLIVRTSQALLAWPPDPRGFVRCGSMRRAYAAAVFVNVALFVACVWGLFAFLIRVGLAREVAALSAAQLAISPMVWWHLSAASLFATSLGIVVASLWIFAWLVRSPRPWRAGLAGGLLLGILMLARANYEVLALGWIICAWRRRFGVLALSFLAHLIPLGAWILGLSAYGLKFWNPEAEQAGMGVWLLTELPAYAPAEAIRVTGALLGAHGLHLLGTFGPVAPAAALTGLRAWRRAPGWPAGWLVTGLALQVAFLFAIRRPLPHNIFLAFPGVFVLGAMGLHAAYRSAGERGSTVPWKMWAGTYLLAATGAAALSLWFTWESLRYGFRGF